MAMGRVFPLVFVFVLLITPLFLSAQNNDAAALPALKPARTLHKGMSGSDVQTLQKYLTLMPDLYPAGSVTGYFGSATEAAIKLLQVREGLVDPKTAGAEYGTVGPKTLATIRKIVLQGSPATTTLQTAPKPEATSTPAPATSNPSGSKKI